MPSHLTQLFLSSLNLGSRDSCWSRGDDDDEGDEGFGKRRGRSKSTTVVSGTHIVV